MNRRSQAQLEHAPNTSAATLQPSFHKLTMAPVFAGLSERMMGLEPTAFCMATRPPLLAPASSCTTKSAAPAVPASSVAFENSL
jgi:hypothetical protein